MQRLQELRPLVTSAYVELAITERDQRLFGAPGSMGRPAPSEDCFCGRRLCRRDENWRCLPEAEDGWRRQERASC